MERFQHDIPPTLVIHEGSFQIEADKKLYKSAGAANKYQRRKDTSEGEIEPGTMMLIKIVRQDDGAILYQNFSADKARLSILLNNNKSVSLKNISNASEYLEIESDDPLVGEAVQLPGNRKYSLKHTSASIQIKEVNVYTLSGNLIYKNPPPSDEYPDVKYRILIYVEPPSH